MRSWSRRTLSSARVDAPNIIPSQSGETLVRYERLSVAGKSNKLSVKQEQSVKRYDAVLFVKALRRLAEMKY